MEKLRNLTEEINKHIELYYYGEPIISDMEFDKLYDELVKLEKELGTKLENSPTTKVGGEGKSSGFTKVEHRGRLWSLDKAQTEEELKSWFDKITKNQGKVDFIISRKFDGLTVNLSYNTLDESNGMVYVRGASRGNGKIGEDITENVRTMIPEISKVTTCYGDIDFHGEAILTKEAFDEYNKSAKTPLKNLRNGAAGGLRNLDPLECRRRNLSMYLYDVSYSEIEFLTYESKLEFIKMCNLPVADYWKTSSFEGILNAIRTIETGRGELNYDIDGVVIAVDDMKLRKDLGYTEKFPRFAIAYKFKAEETTTIVKDIIWQIGKFGTLTPVADIEEVNLCGADITRATLNNIDDIERKGIKKNCRVLIRRSNDVIPEIMGSMKDDVYDKLEKFEIPKRCPICGCTTKQDGPRLFCTCNQCPGRLLKALSSSVSREAMNVVGMSEKILEGLDLRGLDELYDLTVEDLSHLGPVQSKKIHTAIQKSRKCKLQSVIYALNIPSVGIKLAGDLARRYGSLDNMKDVTVENLCGIDGVAETTALQISTFMSNEKNIKLIERLEKRLDIESAKPINTNGEYAGQTVLITGSIGVSRKELAEKIKLEGGKVVSSVSKNTTLVIAGDKATKSKIDKAKELGIKIITV